MHKITTLKLRQARAYILKRDLRSVLVARAPWLKAHKVAGDTELVRNSGLLDESYYRSQLPTGFKVKDPLVHYLVVGARWGVSPHPLFDSDWYSAQSPEVANLLGMSPLVHFLRFGVREGLNPNPLFDTAWYVRQNSNAVEAGLNPLCHFDRIGWKELRDPSPRFSTREYLAAHPDVRNLGMNPLSHYLTCVKPWQEATEGVRLAPPAETGDFLFWGMFPWFFTRQRPQQLAKTLADLKHRVFYFENTFERAAEPGFLAEPLDDQGRLFRIKLHCRAGIDFYGHAPGPKALSQMQHSVACFVHWARLRRPVSLVQHAFWNELARWVPNGRMVYDCFDLHQGLRSQERPVLRAEEALCRDADLVVTSSIQLQEFAAGKGARNPVVIRNAAEFERFSHAPTEVFKDPQGRRTIGYFGAIAEWFDVDLVGRVARAYPECRVVLIGRDEVNARRALARFANVECTGELPYAELPAHLYGFDVAIIPFKVLPLTLATNPVKVYEYLSAGRPVVSVNLPELAQFGDLVRTADTAERFVQLVGEAMAEPLNDALVQARRQFAATQTWGARAQALLDALAAAPAAQVSVVVIADNDTETTRACLANLEQNTDYENYEVILIDHFPTEISQLLAPPTGSRLTAHLRQNQDTHALPAANGDPRESGGEYIVLLDSRTRVMKGWLRTLVRHLHRDPELGLVCPLDNHIAGETDLDIGYRSSQEMVENVLAFTSAHPGETLQREAIPLRCAAIPRNVLDKAMQGIVVDRLDGNSLCRGIRNLGLKIACAKDVFVDYDQGGQPTENDALQVSPNPRVLI